MPADRPLRILHLLNNLSDRGNGIVNVAVDLAMWQARRGIVVAFASGGRGYEPLLASAGVQCLRAPDENGGVASAVLGCRHCRISIVSSPCDGGLKLDGIRERLGHNSVSTQTACRSSHQPNAKKKRI
jgi:hypothetical protein